MLKKNVNAIILFGVAAATNFWLLTPHISTYTNASLHTALLQFMLMCSSIVINLFLLNFSHYVQRKQITTSWLIKNWLLVVTIGTALTIFIMCFSNKLNISVLYNALFPVSRNTYPLIIAIAVGLPIVRTLKLLTTTIQQRVATTIFIILGICSIFSSNMFGFADFGNVTIYILLIVLSGMDSVYFTKLQTKKIFLLTILLGIINTILQIVTPYFVVSVGSGNVNRFSGSANILTVTISYLIFLLLQKIVPQRPAINITKTLVVFTIVGNPAISKLVSSSGVSTGKAGFLSIIITVLAFIMTTGISKLYHSKKIIQLSNQIFCDFSFSSFWARYKLDIITLCIFYITSLISFLLMNDSLTIAPNTGTTYNLFIYIIGTRQALLLLTTLLTFTFFKCLTAVFTRYWVSMAITIVAEAIIVIANIYKINAREEPILPSDMAMMSVLKDLLGMLSPVMLILVGIIILMIIFVVTLLEHQNRIAPHLTIKKRIVWLLIFPLICFSSLFWNHQNSPLNNIMTNIGNSPIFYNQLTGARLNGPIIQFMNNLDITVMKKPTGYSKKTMDKIAKRYSVAASKINVSRTNELRDQTLVFNLSESFSNPNRVPGIKLSHNPIPSITKLEKKNTGGTMISSGYGGGTANMEYMTLTGFSLSNFAATLSVPYSQLVTNLKSNPSIANSFSKATAIHSYIGTFYSRIEVYKKFGFQKFMYLGSKYRIKHQQKIDNSTYLSDKTAYANAFDQINSHNSGQFINLVTMQNHFPYDKNFYNNADKINVSIASDNATNKNMVQDFTTGIKYTDTYVKQFVQKIDKINKPITVVFYGDHLPGIYANDMAKDGLKLHETEYFIYSNKYARNHGAKTVKTNTKYVDPNDFIALAAEQTNSKVNSYQALLTKVQKELPAVALNTQQQSTNSFNTDSEFINNDGKIVKEKTFTGNQKKLWHDYKLVQYDITSGHHYLLKSTMFK